MNENLTRNTRNWIDRAQSVNPVYIGCYKNRYEIDSISNMDNI